jgi:hypothetical protein
MPFAVLTPAQLATLLDWVQVQPGPGSPLHAVPTAAPLPAGDPALRVLVATSVLQADTEPETEGCAHPRVNRLAGAALAACARPDEVLWVTTGESEAGYTVCRLGPLFSECTVLGDGRVKVSFPLSRSQVQLAMTSALSGDRPEPPSVGFRFRGSPAEAFLLRVLLDGARRGGLAPADLPREVAAALDDPIRLLAFGAMGGIEELHALIEHADALDVALARLDASGNLRLVRGRLLPSSSALAVLGAPVLAMLTVGRRIVREGLVRQSELFAYRCGDRLLMLRAVPMHGEPVLELTELTRRELRCHIGAFLLDDRPLTRRFDHGAVTPAPSHSSAGTSAWQPTHLLPEDGTRSWAAPDPSAPEHSRLAGRLPVAVVERRGAWARVRASNGWTGWVDGRRLRPLPPA